MQVYLFQFFNNPIDNTIKYTLTGAVPNIKITLTSIHRHEIHLHAAIKQLEYYAIKNADNGIGFEKQSETKIFEVFSGCTAEMNIQEQVLV